MSKPQKLYFVIASTNFGNLEEAVNRAIANGWKPQGGISATPLESSFQFFQAMTRTAKDADSEASQ